MSARGVSGRWVVLLAVKPLPLAKSRLDRPDRSALTVAMATDTVAVAAGLDTVAAVLVVTDDDDARRLLSPVATVVPDTPAAGLNPALEHGAAEAARRWPQHGVAVLAADLPALQPDALRQALELAGAHERSLVADAGGTGTVMLAAVRGVALDPRFGPDSRDRHRRSGAEDLTDHLPEDAATDGLRRDVDTAEDLAVAVGLGVGPVTSRVLHVSKIDVNKEFTLEWHTAPVSESPELLSEARPSA